MKSDNPRIRLASLPGRRAMAGIRTGTAALLGIGIAVGQSTAPDSTTAARPAESGELGVPGYVTPPVLAPTANGPRPANAATPGAGVVNDFVGLQNMQSSGVPYLGGAGIANGNGGGRLLNWDRGSIGLGAHLDFTYVDNAVQQIGGGGGEDFVIAPTLTLSGTQMVSENANLSMSVGVGYRYSVNYSDLTQLNLVPLGSLNYSLTLGEVLITFFDRISSPSAPRAEIAAGGLPSGVDFNRIENQAGVSSAWSLTEDTTISGMYGFLVDRSLSDAYQILNRDAHTISGGVFHRPSPYWSIGVTSHGTFTSFRQKFQNDSTSFGAGPVVSFRPTPFITLTAGLQYTVMNFGSSGQISDRSEFSGLTWQGSASQVLSDSLTHSLTFSSGVDSGLGSNFTESTRVGYNVLWRFLPQMSLSGSFEYNRIVQSSAVDGFAIVTVNTGTFIVPVSFIANDEASLYMATLGTGYQLTERTSTSLFYNFQRRSSRFADRSFSVNSVTLAFNFQF